jgi:hypothetical protein
MSEGLVNVGSFAGPYSHALHLISHLSECRVRRVVHRLKLCFKAVSQGFRLLKSLRELVLLALARGANVWELASLSDIFHNDWSSLSKDSSISLY